MRWYTLLSYDPGFKLIYAGAETRHINEAVGGIDSNKIMDEQREWLKELHGAVG